MSLQCLSETKFLPESFASYSGAGVKVHEFEPRWQYLEWSTCIYLSGVDAPVPGSTKVIEEYFRRLMKNVTRINPGIYPSCVYANPSCLVTSGANTQEFRSRANQAKTSWQDCLKGFLFSGYHREYKRRSKITRQLEFSGVLIIDHRHRFPNDWPKLA